jgi:serine/threonine-protein kinase HipA
VERELEVWLDLAATPIRVGRLWVRVKAQRETSSFTYDPEWLKRPDRFALGPSLMLAAGQFHSDRPLFQPFTDAAPDSWGQRLIRRQERNRAKLAGGAPRSIFQADYLLGVADETRMGALRLKEPGGGSFLSASAKPVPPLIDIAQLLNAAAKFEKGKDTPKDLALVLAPGTSLGGARPKATVRERDGGLLIAKFPKADDEWPVILWEAVALRLAGAAGIPTADWRIERVARKPVLLQRRFDRRGAARVPFLSAMSALDAQDMDQRQHAYPEIADFIRQEGATPAATLAQLWRRMAFNVLISNTDDHLRNHGFLRVDRGWDLSPAYDMNPTPTDIKPRVHALALDDSDPVASLDTLLSIAPRFALRAPDARAILAEVAQAVAGWRDAAKAMGLKASDIERMESAFEHEDANAAHHLSVVAAPKAMDKPKRRPLLKARGLIQGRRRHVEPQSAGRQRGNRLIEDSSAR